MNLQVGTKIIAKYGALSGEERGTVVWTAENDGQTQAAIKFDSGIACVYGDQIRNDYLTAQKIGYYLNPFAA